MDWKIRLGLGSALLAAALVGGVYLAGYLTLALIGVTAELSWHTWWPYWQATSLPQFAPQRLEDQASDRGRFRRPAGRLASCVHSATPHQATLPTRRVPLRA